MPFLTQKQQYVCGLGASAVLAWGVAVWLVQTGSRDESEAERNLHRRNAKDPSWNWNRPKAGPGDEASDGGNSSRGGGSVSTQGDGANSLLPLGIDSADGRGGIGVHRAVLKDGVWYPVFSPGQALLNGGPLDESPLTSIPLSITSGSPPPGRTNVPFVFDFEAIGGSPPYLWRFSLADARASFAMDSSTGLLSGISEVPLNTVLEVFVRDAAGAQDSARYPLVIEEPSPLAIATTSLPNATAGSAYATRLNATGGNPPYFWTVAGLEPVDLALTANTGELNGQPESPGIHALQISVADQAEASKSTELTLTVGAKAGKDETDESTDPAALRITTTTLPEATANVAYAAQLTGEGGTPPYTWALTPALPNGLTISASTGAISGNPTGAGEFGLQATLSDQAGAQATQNFTLRIVNGLEITTASPLLPASPGAPYQVTFSATGGTVPYLWRVRDGALPNNGAGVQWTLSPDGVLSGVAAPTEGLFRFAVEVQDAAARTFTKTFDLPVRLGLIAVPSREKAGLAWRPDQMDAQLRSSGTALAAVAVVRSVGGFPPTPAAGVLVYQGTGNNIVDHNLPTGSTIFYSLFAQTVDGRVLPYATTAVTIRPMTLQRARPGLNGDPYADRVTAFQPLRSGGYGAADVPRNITGPPDGKGTLVPASLASEVASLHAREGAGGSVTLEFTDNIVELRQGADLTVFENVFFVGGDTNDRFMEPGIVWVALFDGEWFRFPIDVVPPAAGETLKLNDPFYYNRGFAGRNPTTGSDPTNPNVSGGDSFDADQLGIPGLTWIRFVRIQSTGDNAWVDDFGGDPVRHTSLNGALSGGGTSGFDLDTVSAVNY